AGRAALDRIPEEVLRLVPRPRPLPAAVQGRARAGRDAGRGRAAAVRGGPRRRRGAERARGRAARCRGRRRPRPADLDLRRGLGVFGGTVHALGTRWSFRGKDAGSARTWKVRARLRTQTSGRAPRPEGLVTVSSKA